MQNKTQQVQKAQQTISNASTSTGMKYSELTGILSSMTEITRLRAEISKSEVDIKRLDVKEKILLLDIERKYETINKAFALIFAERKDAVNKSFEVINKGLSTNDKELISMGLTSLSTVVAASPFANMKALSEVLEGKGNIEI